MDCEVLPASLVEADNCISITNPFYPLYGTLYRSKYWWNSQPPSLCAHPRFGLEGAFISAAKPPRLHKWIICFRISAPRLHTQNAHGMPNRSTTDIDRLSPVNAISSHFHFPLKNVLAGFNRREMLDHIKRYIFMGHVGEYISVSEVYCTNNFHSPPHHTSSILSAFWLPIQTCCCLRRAIVLNLGIKRSSNCEVF